MVFSSESVLEGLTDPQREAASTIEGPLLVLAGAGSGKTRTITRRVAFMIANGIPAYNILAITFTNKAAKEMKERIDHLLQGAGRAGRGVTVATFHALGARIVREFADVVDLPKTFSIFDSADQTRLIKQAIKDLNLSTDNFQPAAVHSTISNAKNKLQTPAAFTQAAGNFYEKNVAKLYTRYEALLRENKAVDFDDLILKTAVILRDNKQARETLQDRYQYILIDEYQDTNHAQFVIAHVLAMNHKNICATGDPDQSIYGWRGANLNNIMEFEQFFPNAKVVLLEQNYRSTKVILQAASALIARNTKRKKKDLWTENEAGDKIEILQTNDEHQEAAEIVKRLKEQHDKGLHWDKMAIFYRVNSLSRVLEDALMKAAVPYQIARGTEFYGRKEVKDVLAYLRVIANPDDSVSLERIINVPPRGLGDTSITRIETFASDRGMSLLQACAIADQVVGLTPRAANAARKLAQLFTEWRAASVPVEPATAPANASAEEAVSDGTDPLFDPSFVEALADSEEYVEEPQLDAAPLEAAVPAAVAAPVLVGGIRGLMERIVRESGIEAEAKKQEDADHETSSNISELITVAAEFDAQNPGGTLGSYLEQVTLISDVDKIQDSGGAVTLMTLHAAKGLEFPFVAMVGVEDGLIPHARAIGFTNNPDELEEERRLAFVGITRAMKKLVLSYARYRTIRGMSERTIASQFLQEMPDECFDEVDLTGDPGPAGSPGYRDEASYARRAQQRSEEAVEQRHEAISTAQEFRRGILVRHPQFGLGRIEDITPAGAMTKAVVQFQGSGRKTLILQYARLERVDA
jgi:DNA helicase II / ATP-dependent DNA helicase PcrA